MAKLKVTNLCIAGSWINSRKERKARTRRRRKRIKRNEKDIIKVTLKTQVSNIQGSMVDTNSRRSFCPRYFEKEIPNEWACEKVVSDLG